MAVTFVGASTPRARSNATHVIDMPPGLAPGDYIVLFIFSGNDGLVSRVTPNGYTELEHRAITAPPFVALTYGRIADGSEAPVTFTGGANNIQGLAVAYRGVDPDTPIAGTNSDLLNVGSGTWQPNPAPPATVDNSRVAQFTNIFNLDTDDGTSINLSPTNGWNLDGSYISPNTYPQNSAGFASRPADVVEGALPSPGWNPGITNVRYAVNTITLNPSDGTPPPTLPWFRRVQIGGADHTLKRGGGGSLLRWATGGSIPPPVNPLGGLIGVHPGNFWIPNSPVTVSTLRQFEQDATCFISYNKNSNNSTYLHNINI